MLPCMSKIGAVSTSSNGVDVDFKWRMDTMFFKEEDGVSYSSPKFFFGGHEWELWIFPHGYSGCCTSGHVDLSLMKSYNSPDIVLDFSLSLENVNREKDHKQTVSEMFSQSNFVYKCYRFIPLLELLWRQSELVPKGVLTIVCTMKNVLLFEIASKSLYAA